MRHFSLTLGLLTVLLLPALLPAGAATGHDADVTQGPWRVQFTGSRGVVLWYDCVPITRQSTLYLIKPGWTGLLYDQRSAVPSVTVASVNGGQVITAHDKSDAASIGYTITLAKDNTVTVALRYALTRDVPVDIEYASGYVNAALIAGRPFQALTPEGPKSGIVPYSPPGTTQEGNRFVPSFQALTVETRLGRLQISVAGDWPDFLCFDARSDPQEWAREAPIFWMGLGVTPHPVAYDGGRTFHVITTYQMTPAPAVQAAGSPATVHVRAAPVALADARAPQETTPIIIPTPKRISLTKIRLRLGSRTRLVIADTATEQDKAAALAVRQELATRCGLPNLPIVRARDVSDLKDIIVFGEPPRIPLAARLLAKAGAWPATKAEGYTLRVGPNWAVIAGHDPAGTYYGAQSICQLLGRDAQGAFVWGAAIDDYPSLAWRGAHLFVGAQALPFHKKLIANILARFKLNNLVLQCEQAQWDTLGKSAPSWAMSKSDLKREIAFAHRHYMTVTPLVNSVGHMEWLFSDPARLGLAEDPQTPYAANVTSPATYQFLFRLYDEVLDTFHSKYLHIGGDEVTMRGRYPDLSRGAYPTVADAFIAHVDKVHAYLKSRGVGTMLWGDMLLNSTETQDAANAPTLAQAQQMRAALPKDIAIADWHYAGSGDFSSPETFRTAGFQKVIAATWYKPQNIYQFSREQAQNHQWGLLQTTWAGYNSNASNLTDDPKQFTAFVLAAEWAWDGGSIPPDKLPYEPARVFAEAYDPQPINTRSYPGFALDLSGVANRTLADDASGAGWLGDGPQHDLRALPTGRLRLDGIRYQIAPRALFLHSPLVPNGTGYPAEANFTLHRKARALSLLLTTAYAALPQAEVGHLTVTYADGEHRISPLIYGQTIAAWGDPQDAPGAPTVWQGRTQAGDPIFLRALTWKNPSPQKTIASLAITETDPTVAPVVLAITGLTDSSLPSNRGNRANHANRASRNRHR